MGGVKYFQCKGIYMKHFTRNWLTPLQEAFATIVKGSPTIVAVNTNANDDFEQMRARTHEQQAILNKKGSIAIPEETTYRGGRAQSRRKKRNRSLRRRRLTVSRSLTRRRGLGKRRHYTNQGRL